MIALTKLALKRPVTICMAILTLFVFGIGSALTAPMELMPDMEMPVLIVMNAYPGAAPEDVEDQVTSYIEDAVSTLSGVKNVRSTSMENASIVMMEFDYGTDITEARNDLSANLEIYTTMMPEDANDPTIVEISMDMMPVITLSATATGDVNLKYYVEEEIQPEIEKIGGVASVSVSGGASDYIKIALKEEKLAQYGLNMSTITSLVSSADFSVPAGSIGQGNLDMTLRGGVQYDSMQSLGDMPITLATGDIIHLSDVADIYQATNELDSLSYYNGRENVTLSISKQQSAPTIATANDVLKVVEEINASDMGVHLEVVSNTSDDIKASIMTVLETLALGCVLAMIVLFIFLGEWKASLIVGSSIPLSLLVTLIAMSLMGFSYNMLSLGGLVIGVGMMVDNSIVVIESCFRLKASRESFMDAALEGTKAVANSIAAGTITTVVVFLPMALIKGMSGQMFKPLCFTIVFSLLASLISAITIVPLTFLWLKPVESEPKLVMRGMDKLSTWYAKVLPKTFKCKWLVVLVSVAMLVGSVALIPTIGLELMPATDNGVIEISMDVRPGTNLDTINEYLRPIEEMVTSHPDLEKYTMTSGGSGLAILMGGSAEASITAYLRDDREMKTDDVVAMWREQTKNAKNYELSIEASSSTSMMMSSGGDDVEITLQGMDFEDLGVAASMVEKELEKNPHLTAVMSSLASGTPQAEVVIDPVKAAARGLVPAQVMGQLYTVMSGADAFTMVDGGREYDVRIEYPNDRFQTVSDLASLTFNNAGGIAVPLLDIAHIEYSNSPLSITSQNGRYVLSVTAQELAGAPKDIADQAKAQAAKVELPKGVEIVRSSSDQSMIDEFTALLIAIASAVFLVFVVMAMQFESPVFSGVVMVSMPFSMIGSMLCLLLFNCTINMTSLMGFLMLAGTTVNNGILFIDTANAIRDERNLSAEDAALTSGMLRMRPIFMTTLTTVLAMVPMAIGFGENAALMRSMSLVVIGGLTASTILTLLLMPTFYLLTDKRERQRKKAEKKAKKEAAKAAKAAN